MSPKDILLLFPDIHNTFNNFTSDHILSYLYSIFIQLPLYLYKNTIMHTSYISLPLMAIALPAVLGAPSLGGKAPKPVLAARDQTGMVDFGGKLDDEGNKISKRQTGMVDYGGKLDDNGNKISKKSSLETRKSDYISSCGSEWVPVDDFQNNSRWYMGYREAVKLFCTHITSDYEGKAAVVGPKSYAGTTIYTNDAQEQIGLDNGQDPTESVTPGHIEFEIHNKQSSGDHTPTREPYLKPF